MSEVAEQKRILGKDEYYQDSKLISFSQIKVFSRCETLYRDLFVTKTYQEPDHDYFLYGKLVDAMVTESPKYIEEHFALVDKKVKVEDALRYENEVKTLQQELVDLEPKVLAGNKTAEKGKAKREREIEELNGRLAAIRNIDGKEQVTRSIWENAEGTALAIKTHPVYSSMVFDQFTSQQIIVANVNGTMRKGRLDHLKLCPQIERYYKLFVANQITYEQMIEKILPLNQSELWASITDIKTCYDVAKLEPYNTHYRGQLGFYQDLVSEFFLIPRPQIKCHILVGDKLSSEFKKSEYFIYSQESLDEVKPDVEAWVKLWKKAVETNTFVSAKAKKGFEQECYTCTECRFAPFSKNPGQPVLISQARFANKANIGVDTAAEGTEDHSVVVEY